MQRWCPPPAAHYVSAPAVERQMWALARPAGAPELRCLTARAVEGACPFCRKWASPQIPGTPVWGVSAGSLVQHLFEARSEGPRALIAVVHRACVQEVVFPFWRVVATKGEGDTSCCAHACANERPSRAPKHAQLSPLCGCSSSARKAEGLCCSAQRSASPVRCRQALPGQEGLHGGTPRQTASPVEVQEVLAVFRGSVPYGATHGACCSHAQLAAPAPKAAPSSPAVSRAPERAPSLWVCPT